MRYPRYVLHEEIKIRKLISFFYAELPKSFVTSGEKHNFWEFIYIDKGEISAITADRFYLLKQGDMLFYKPNDFHAGHANHKAAPNIIILSFECNAPCMSVFEYRQLHLTPAEQALLFEIVKAGLETFDPPQLRHVFPLRRNEGAPFGSEQMIKNYLEILLLQLIRRTLGVRSAEHSPAHTLTVQEAAEIGYSEQIQKIIRFMRANLARNLTLETLCHEFSMSKSQLKSLFKAQTGCGIIAYFNHQKIAEAKMLIRDERHNFTEIAEMLGYSSIHYFSAQFKKITDMTPSEYAKATGAKLVSSLKSPD